MRRLSVRLGSRATWTPPWHTVSVTANGGGLPDGGGGAADGASTKKEEARIHRHALTRTPTTRIREYGAVDDGPRPLLLPPDDRPDSADDAGADDDDGPSPRRPSPPATTGLVASHTYTFCSGHTVPV